MAEFLFPSSASDAAKLIYYNLVYMRFCLYVAGGTRFAMLLLATNVSMSLADIHVIWFNVDLYIRVAIDECHVSGYCIREQRFC
jgi:hypothetical protein